MPSLVNQPVPWNGTTAQNGTEVGIGDVGLIVSHWPAGTETPVHRHTFASAIVIVGARYG